jgi:hypothetical protein
MKYAADESSAMTTLFGKQAFIVYETPSLRVEAVTFSMESAERIAQALSADAGEERP